MDAARMEAQSENEKGFSAPALRASDGSASTMVAAGEPDKTSAEVAQSHVERVDTRPSETRVEISVVDEIEYRTMDWWHAGIVMIAETISLGILSLPHVLSEVGVLPGIICILFIGGLATYTGYVVYQIKMAYPEIRNFPDAFQRIFGPTGRWITEVFSVLLLVFIMAAHIVTFSVMLNVLTGHGACTIIFSVVAMIASFLLTIPRTLKGTSVVSMISCASICIAVIIAMVAIGIQKPDLHDAYLVTPSSKATFVGGVQAVAHIVVAFTGHVAYFNIIDEMKVPRDFPKALALLQISAISFYITVAVVIYTFAGSTVKSPALGSARPLVSKICYGIAIPTILVAGVIGAHICAKRLYDLLWKKNAGVKNEKSFRARGSWWAIIGALWVLAWLIAEAIPIFSSLLGVIGAAFTTWFCLGFNSIMWLGNESLKGVADGKKWADVRGMLSFCYFGGWRKTGLTLLNVLIVLVSASICVLGLYGSGVAIAKSDTDSSPFSCADNQH